MNPWAPAKAGALGPYSVCYQAASARGRRPKILLVCHVCAPPLYRVSLVYRKPFVAFPVYRVI